MKKVLLALILAGGTIFAANARGVVIEHPGFYLNVGRNVGPVVVVPPIVTTPVYVPAPRFHRPILPPKRHHGHHRPRGKHRRH